MENDLKMSEKWTKNANCERPYCHFYLNFLESIVFKPKISTVLFWIGKGKNYRTNAQNGL